MSFVMSRLTRTTSARSSTARASRSGPGHHCCQPVMHRLGVPATARASLAFYNTREDVDRFVDALARVREMFG